MISRRHLMMGTVAGLLASVSSTRHAQAAAAGLGINAADLGIRPDPKNDQTVLLQRAIDHAARQRLPLLLPPGTYRAGDLRLPAFARLSGLRGATRLVLSKPGPLFWSEDAANVELSELTLDGADLALMRGALIRLAGGHQIGIRDCDVVNAGGPAVFLERIAGEVAGNYLSAIADVAIHSLDAAGLIIRGNTIRNVGNNGIRIYRSQPGADGTLVVDNRLENIRSDAGGSGQNGNAINVFRAGNVIVRGNQISKAAFSAIRGNSASNLQVVGNTCSDLGEVAIFSEFAFQGAVIANNVVERAVIGISVTNYDYGGRLAVIQGNILRNIGPKREPMQGVGIRAEADTVVSGNVIEKASEIGIALGYGAYLRDVSVTGNVIRETPVGVGVSVSKGAGNALVADNIIAETTRAAIAGMEGEKVVTGDLARENASRYAQLSISGNWLR